MAFTTLQKILADDLEGILSRNRFSLDQYRALCKLSQCRTAALGGHAQYCSAGHLNGVWYNSCKHRACPQCQGKASESWLLNTQDVLLNCPHHHVIFTLPESLNNLWRYNRELMSGLLFQAVQDTLKTFSRDPRYLAAMPGLLLALHTWGRSLSLHPHLHVLISHGGINKDGHWVEPKKRQLFPQKPVMQVYRGKILGLLRQALTSGELVLPPDRRHHHAKAQLNKLGRQDWVVHFCKRYDHARGVAKYLARYVKGGPFNNQQLVSVSRSQICFRYKSHQTGRQETLRLTPDEFIQRLVQHVPIHGKPSLRYGGLYTSPARRKLNEARKQLNQAPVSQRSLLAWQDYLEGKGFSPSCEVCGEPLFHREAVKSLRSVA